MIERVVFGIDQLLEQPGKYRGGRIALVCTQASVTSELAPSRVALLEAGFNIVKLFAPEHGLDARGADGLFQQDGIDTLTMLPVISLYGERLKPRPEDLKNIDLVLVDLPDVGSRFYTYLWTMTLVMEACTECGIPLLITDRPNPIGGILSQAEGPMLNETCCASFIGRWSIPIRHSCTLGELALYFKAIKMPGLQLAVIPALNWQRQQMNSYYFTPTSPAIRDFQTALLYAGTGLLEGINVNEGRGTIQPFTVFGAPWIREEELHELFQQNMPSGIKTEKISYVPSNSLYSGELCHGLKLEVIGPEAFRPVQTGIALISTLLKLYPSHCRERLYDTHANPGGQAHLDKLLGIVNAFKKISSQAEIKTNISLEWTDTIKGFLLYS